MSVAAFGLAAGLSWGVGDFAGGLATRRIGVYAVIVVSYAVGLLLLTALALVSAERFPLGRDLGWASAAGASGALGLIALWRALAVGKMGIAAPATAVMAAAVPVVFASVTVGIPGGMQILGLVLAFAGLWLVSRRESGGRTVHPAALRLALIAGLGFGLYFVLIRQAAVIAVYWTLVAARGTSLLLVVVLALAAGGIRFPPRHLLPLVLAAGMLDVTGNVFFVIAARAGRLDVAAVLASLYPAATVVLARMVLRERLARLQVLGIVVALIAIPLLVVP